MIGVEDHARPPGAVVVQGVDVEGRDCLILMRGKQMRDRELPRAAGIKESGQGMNEHRRVDVNVVGVNLVKALWAHLDHSLLLRNSGAITVVGYFDSNVLNCPDIPGLGAPAVSVGDYGGAQFVPNSAR